VEDKNKKQEVSEAVEAIRDGVEEMRSEVKDGMGEFSSRLDQVEAKQRKRPETGLGNEANLWRWTDYLTGVQRNGDIPKGFTRDAVEATRAIFGETDTNAPVPTEVMSTIIEPLKQASTIGQAGARFLEGLSGTVNIPVATSPELVDRGSGGSGGDDDTAQIQDQTGSLTFTNVTLNAAYSGEMLQVGRDLLQQNVPSVERYVREQIQKAAQRNLDARCYTALKADLTASDSDAVDVNMTRTILETAVKAIAAANGDVNNLTFVSHANIVYDLAAAAGVEGRSWTQFASPAAVEAITGIKMIVDSANFTGTDNDGQAVLGDFSDFVVGLFGQGIEIAQSEHHLFDYNAVAFRVTLACDAAVLRTGSFYEWDDLDVT